MDDRDDYVLGEDVTHLAAPKGKRDTAVISVRLATQELRELDALSKATGKTISQVVREALAAFRYVDARSNLTLTVSVQDGPTMMFGSPTQITYGYVSQGSTP